MGVKAVLYLLIVIGFFFYSLIKDKRSKTTGNEPEDPNPDPRGGVPGIRPSVQNQMDSYRRRLEENVSPYEEKFSSGKKQSPKTQKKSSSPFLSGELENYASTYESFSGKNKKKKNKDKNMRTEDAPISASEIGSENEISFDTPEDAKRAFIYSEIWNRKY